MLSFSALVFAGVFPLASFYCDRMMIKQFLTLDDLGIYDRFSHCLAFYLF